MNIARQIFGTHYGSNRPVTPRQRALLARSHMGRGYVAAPEEVLPETGAVSELVAVLPRFIVDFNGQRPAGMTVNVRNAASPEASFPAAA